MQLTLEDVSQQELENVDLLTTMLACSPDVALRALRKYNGSMEKAADALLAGEIDEQKTWDVQQPAATQPQGTTTAPNHGTAAPQGTPQGSVIDLTGDNDDEFSRALKLSLDTASNTQEAKFGPSERAPDPNWQMVPSNVAVGQIPNVSQEEQNLNDAIKASLDDFAGDDADDYPPENAIRADGRPLVLRSETSALAYAAQIVHALYFVPQVRAALADLSVQDTNLSLPRGPYDRAIWNLIEMFCHMDLAKLAAICDAELLPSLEAVPCKEPGEEMIETSTNFLKKLGSMIESYQNAAKGDESRPDSRLFTFIHGSVEFSTTRPRRVRTTHSPGDIVVVNLGPDNPHNDLISSLVGSLSRDEGNTTIHDVIVEPSEMVAFRIKRASTSQTAVKAVPEPFAYSKTIYLDQFLLHNAELVLKNRAKERDINRERANYEEKRNKLTRLDNRDVLKDLQATIYYYEKLADTRDDDARKEELSRTTEKLKTILSTVTQAAEEIDQHIESLINESSEIFNCPELQKHRYDLRAVLMQTGLPGRKQIYSYVQDDKGTWWKIHDYTVTEVHEEVVLTDSTGLHLNAGPYLLIYSRHVEPSEINNQLLWPEVLVNAVQENNETLLRQLESSPPNYSMSLDSQNVNSVNSPNVMDLSVD